MRVSGYQLNAMEGILAGALRREQEAESCQKRLAAEIEQLTRLVSTKHSSLCHLDDGHQVLIFTIQFVDFSKFSSCVLYVEWKLLCLFR